MEIRIRRGQRSDYETLAALGGWPGVAASAARSVRLFKRVIADLAYDLYVAEEAGQLLGLVAVSYARSLPLGGQRATMEELYVRPERRGEGVGRQLLDFVWRRALRRGVRAFEATAGDEVGERFLDRAGFRPSGRRFARPLDARGRGPVADLG